MRRPTPEEFQTSVYDYYKKHGRHALPWRKTKDPYKILVSEIMLQQTQVERVTPKFLEFLKRFPSVGVLARASLGDVLRHWQGLGYNRRAKHLHECARAVLAQYAGTMPHTYDGLLALPGIGPYTAAAVMAFAYNKPVVMIETNIRTAYIHHFFNGKKGITDMQLRPLIEQTLDQKNPRKWYSALMDYGSHLKVSVGNPSRNSAHYTKQKKFKGSDREIRGALLRLFTLGSLSEKGISKKLIFDSTRIHKQLSALEKEGMVVRKRGTYSLPL